MSYHVNTYHEEMSVDNIIQVTDDGVVYLPSHTDLGSYPLIYIDYYNDTLCAPCAVYTFLWSDDWKEHPAVGEVYYEGPDVNCIRCNVTIESAYGDPYAEEVD